MAEENILGFLYDPYFKIAHRIPVFSAPGVFVAGSGKDCFFKLPFCAEGAEPPYKVKSKLRAVRKSPYAPWKIQFPERCLSLTPSSLEKNEVYITAPTRAEIYVYANQRQVDNQPGQELHDGDWLTFSPHPVYFEDTLTMNGTYRLICRLGKEGIEKVLSEAREIKPKVESTSASPAGEATATPPANHNAGESI